MPLVSVVIPAHNAEEFLADSIRSALNQTHSPLEVVVVDDGSSDGTAAVARTFGDPVRYVYQENAGPSVARNTGIAEARGEYVAFLDADDQFHPERVARLLEALHAASPTAVFAASEAWLWDGERIWGQMEISRPTAGERNLTDLLDDNRPVTWVLARRDALIRVGGFRPDLWRNEDYHLWLRLLADGHTYTYVPEPLYVYRMRPGSLSSDNAKQVGAACQVHLEALATMKLTPDQRRRLLYLLWRDRAVVHSEMAERAQKEGNREERLKRLGLSAACQTVRVALRPHFSAGRWWRKFQRRRAWKRAAANAKS